MAMIKCSECGADVSDKAPNCPKCGNPINEKPQEGEEYGALEAAQGVNMGISGCLLELFMLCMCAFSGVVVFSGYGSADMIFVFVGSLIMLVFLGWLFAPKRAKKKKR